MWKGLTYEPFHEKTNIMDSALCIEPGQPAQSVQANLGQHIVSQVKRYRVMIPETEKPQEAKSVYPGRPVWHA